LSQNCRNYELICYLIEFSENYVQFWYGDIAIGVEKTKNNTITYEISELE